MRLTTSAVAVLLTAAALTAADAPDFNRDVRPILSQHCLQCHGPDEKKVKAGLRLDSFETATKAGKNGTAIVPGKPDASELVRRILAPSDDEVMPPPHIKKPLTANQKATLREWVAAGAIYQPHWAFIPPRKIPPPSPRHSALNPIDNFILARLEREGLPPNPPADKFTLVRRVYLDLIGLPPTPDEADAFVSDTSADAYDRLVEKLLASPHYGERWARKWLDLARYADTNGYEKDRPRTIWPYRDWVIHALNRDLPFDQFTIEQIAGDLLPNATSEQIIATGFHRNTMLNEEGGIDPLEFRYYAMADRVNTTGTVWLGLTLGCCQCHTHKFDPIPHREYYQIFAFLNNADEPDYEVSSPELRARQSEVDAKLKAMEAALPSKFASGQFPTKFAAWLAAERKQAIAWTVVQPTRTEAGRTKLHLLSDGSLLATGDPTKADVYELTFTNWPAGVTAMRVEALPHESLPADGPGRAYYEGPQGDFLLSDLRVTLDGTPATFADASESYSKLGLIAGKSAAKLAFDDNLQTGWAASGHEGKPSNAVFNLKMPTPAAQSAGVRMTFERHYAASLGRFRISVTNAPTAIARTTPADVEALLLLPDDKLTRDQRDVLQRQFVAVAPELKAARDEIEAVRKQRPRGPQTLIFQERPADHPRKTFVHHRGEFLQPTDEVSPGGLGVLHRVPPGEKPDRGTFARWLIARENPLVARVTVNRAWAAFFGRGLVRTVDDFGYQGEPPTHPALLDWLAVEFMDNGWSMKALHKRIVTSATYRQSARVTPQLLAADPENKLLARFPRVRLDAELIRDAALTASGLLSRKIGGPSVFPPQPPGVTETAYGKSQWKPSTGDDRHRRGLYTYTKRTAPFAMTSTFDGPSGEACVARREVSNTPLQALTMLNDVAMMEAAQAFGVAALAEKGADAKKIETLFRRCLTRPPVADESALLARFFDSQHAKYAADPKAAAALAGGGPGDPARRAAWTAVARAILNLDEFVTKE